jgi:hypothetical protein
MSDANTNNEADGGSHGATPKLPEYRKVADIPDVGYVVGNVSVEPSREDIQKAIDVGELETRGFQSNLKTLNDEWNAEVSNYEEYCSRQKMYHARRIAHFVVNGWSEPIELTADGKIRDGLHRFKAARFLGLKSVEVCIDKPA